MAQFVSTLKFTCMCLSVSHLLMGGVGRMVVVERLVVAVIAVVLKAFCEGGSGGSADVDNGRLNGH